jgi:hypothetical protein
MAKRYIKLFFILLVVLLFVYFGVRKYVLHKVLDRLAEKTEHDFALTMRYAHAGFEGFKTVSIQGFTVVSETGDTVVMADSLKVTPKLIPLLFGKKRISTLFISNANAALSAQLIHAIRRRHHSLLTDTTSESGKASFSDMLYALQSQFFTLIPGEITMRNTGLTYRHDSIYVSVFCEQFTCSGSKFVGYFCLADNTIKEKCIVRGSLESGDHSISATIHHSDTTLLKLPYIEPRWEAMLGFDTLKLSASFGKMHGQYMDINGTMSASRLSIQNKRIGPDPVVTASGQVDFCVHVGDRFIELDSTSRFRINRFSFSPYVRLESDTSKKFACAFIYKEFEAQELFESMPEGLFTSFSGIETTGKLAYHMKASVDFSIPDSVKFVSKLENKGFKIKKYGVTDFRLLNGSFVQDVYDNDRFVKSILVSPENPDFVPLDQISPYLRFSLLTAEDGDFFYHHGFNERAFRESIATNLKENRFARGGSTISMQLVKNVFLSRTKTISRKAEEALIVWMIENMHLSSKERMFEVYLNIIEWGPGIYGIKPAARFYFNKTPGALTLSESIYLSSLVPHPKAFRYTFLTNGVLRDYFSGYFRLLSSIMLRRNQITPADTFKLTPNIMLTGDAKKYLTVPDTIAAEDSLFFVVPKKADLFEVE